MHRPVVLLLTAFLLALPSAALAQSAGDEQYSDPFEETEQPPGTQGDSAPAPDGEAAPAPDDGTAPPESPAATEEAVASQASGESPALPATGLPAALLAGAGVLLLVSGAALRRRAP